MDVDQPSTENRQNATKQVVTAGQLRFAAMSLLARREHSQFELCDKLRLRYGKRADQALIEEVVQQLADEALQSDSRFAEAFVAMRVRKGQGPIRIEKELEQRRVGAEFITRALQPYADEWMALAHTTWVKKYGPNAGQSRQERAKQTRFLLYRGFSMDHIQGLWQQNQNP